MVKLYFSDVVLKKVLDGDFQTIMVGVAYSTTPREVVTIRQMQDHYSKMSFQGLDVYE